MSVTGSCLHLENTVINCQNRNIKCATTQIENQNVLLAIAFGLFIQPISNRCCSWLIDDSQYIQTGNCSGVLCSLSLSVIKISGNRNNCISNIAPQIRLSDLLHFNQNHGRNLFGGKCFLFALKFNLDMGFTAVLLDNLKRPMRHITLNT